MKKEKKVLFYYLGSVLTISAILEAAVIYYGEAAYNNLVALLMFLPMVVAIILKHIFYRKESLLGFRIGKPIYYIFAAIIPLGYIGLSYMLYWLFVPESFAGIDVLITPQDSAGSQNLFIIIIGFLLSFVSGSILALGEETGWRGLMYPTIHKLWGRDKALIISSLVWAGWHLPILVSGQYMAGASLLFAVPMFIIMITAGTVVVSWVKIKSGSIWPAAIWHGMHNFLDQGVFKPMTVGKDMAYYISETGFITTLFAVAIAALILVYGKFEKSSSDGARGTT